MNLSTKLFKILGDDRCECRSAYDGGRFNWRSIKWPLKGKWLRIKGNLSHSKFANGEKDIGLCLVKETHL